MNYIEITKDEVRAGDKVKLQAWGSITPASCPPFDVEILEVGFKLGGVAMRHAVTSSDGSVHDDHWSLACNYRIVED